MKTKKINIKNCLLTLLLLCACFFTVFSLTTAKTASAYILQDSTIIEPWDDDYGGYNCYAFAIDKKDSWYDPGDFSGAVYSIALDIYDIAMIVKEDLEELGFCNVNATSDQPELPIVLKPNEKLICVRKGSTDFHFMKYDYGYNYYADEWAWAWYHKPGGTAILKYNYQPWEIAHQGSNHWTSESYLVKVGVDIEHGGIHTYDSEIYYIYYYDETRYVFTPMNAGSEYLIDGLVPGQNTTILRIPDTYKGKPVTEINDFAFQGCNSLTDVTIPSSVTSIGQYAFTGCNGLQSITIPFIGDALNNPSKTHFGYIFGAPNWSYQNYYIPQSLETVTITGGDVGDYAFVNSRYLTNIILPDSATNIGVNAFCNCESLTSLEIPDSVMFIDEYALIGMTALEAVTVASGNTSFCVQGGVLYDINMTELILYPAAKTGAVFIIPSSVTTVADCAFAYNPYLQKVIIGQNCASIGAYAFEGCSSLEEVFLTQALGVAVCGNYAFDYVANNFKIYVAYPLVNSYKANLSWAAYANKIAAHATTVYFNALGGSTPSSVTIYFGDSPNLSSSNRTGYNFEGWYYSFDGTKACGELFAGVYLGTDDVITFYAKWDIVTYDITDVGAVTLHSDPPTYTIETPTINITAPNPRTGYTWGGWYDNSSFAGSPVTSIPIGSYGNKTLYAHWTAKQYTVTFDKQDGSGGSDYVTATYGNYLPYAAMPDVAPTSGELFCGYFSASGTQYYYSNMQGSRPYDIDGYIILYAKWSELLIDNGVVIAYGGSEASLVIPEGVTAIGDYAFCGNTALESIIIPSSVNSVGLYSFYGCTSLESVIFNADIYLYSCVIWDYAFADCTSLTNVVLPSGIQFVWYCAFYGCTSLESITVPFPESIMSDVFYGCGSLTIYAEMDVGRRWDEDWNSSDRPVVFWCELSDDKSYVVSIETWEILNPNGYTYNPPYRYGYTFGGWSLTQNGTIADYDMTDFQNANAVLYAIWI